MGIYEYRDVEIVLLYYKREMYIIMVLTYSMEQSPS